MPLIDAVRTATTNLGDSKLSMDVIAVQFVWVNMELTNFGIVRL